ncbi:NmrA family protein [Clostridiales bacterium oral taxon 876 str. F0540]|nr:NmrA family protein [Clostridiales bacterium oral taxon 876 str. F0540]
MMEKILVTGFTGNVGSFVGKYLKEEGINYKAAVRNVKKAKEIYGENNDYVEFDFEKASTFDKALDDVDKVFLMRPPAVSDAKRYVKPFIEKAKEKGIKQIVFLSLMGIEHNPIPPHYKIEKFIVESGIPYTFLRPSFFMQNLDTTHRFDIKENNNLFIPAGKSKSSFIDTRDIGEAAAKVLVEDGHLNKAYTLTGAEALDYYEVAEIFSKTLGRKVIFSNPSPLKFRKVMIDRGIDKSFANVMVGLYMSTKMGMAKKVTPELEKLLGRKPISLEKYVQDYVECWK